MKKYSIHSLFILMILSIGLQSCYYKIKSVKKGFTSEQTAKHKEVVLRQWVAARPYVFLISKGQVYQFEKARIIDGKLTGHVRLTDKWMYPIAQRTPEKHLPYNLEKHGHFEEMLYLEVDEAVKEGNYELEWGRVMTYTYYK
ncbi:MAG: hypothetical protein MRZ79_16815 [Bacteroidia bacterium]|nr:hypothetical protein [Bacteroidia bacterium]